MFLVLVLVVKLVVYLAAAICGVVVVVSAFRKSTLQGLGCLFVPLYGYFWAFTQLRHPQRRAILWIMVGAVPVGFALDVVTRLGR